MSCIFKKPLCASSPYNNFWTLSMIFRLPSAINPHHTPFIKLPYSSFNKQGSNCAPCQLLKMSPRDIFCFQSPPPLVREMHSLKSELQVRMFQLSNFPQAYFHVSLSDVLLVYSNITLLRLCITLVVIPQEREIFFLLVWNMW